MNDVPSPHLDLHVIIPPNCSTIILQICNPSPIPLVFSSFVASRNPKSLNNLFRFSSYMPTPVSLTIISNIPKSDFKTTSSIAGYS